MRLLQPRNVLFILALVGILTKAHLYIRNVNPQPAKKKPHGNVLIDSYQVIPPFDRYQILLCLSFQYTIHDVIDDVITCMHGVKEGVMRL